MKKQKKSKNIALSVIVIAKDEQEKIKDCLKSVQFADEIILVDTGSKDKTLEIAEKYGCKVFEYGANGNYSDWRNLGGKKALGKWLLYVDADERVTKSLQKEILDIIKTNKNKFSIYAIPRLNIILGKEMKHGGWWPDYVKRLYRKDALKKWVGALHEEPVFEGEMGHLKNHFEHIKHDNLEDMVEKTNIWSDVEAKLMFDANHPPMNVMRFISAMIREAWLRFVIHKAFLDGKKGIIYATYQVWSKFISYAKLWEMQLEKE